MPRVDNQSFYDKSLQDYGPTAKGMHWHDTRRQEVRFKVLAKLLKAELPRATIVDAGCGNGALFHFLLSLGRPPKHYIGIDAHDKMVELARIHTGQPIVCADIVTDVLPVADYYLCSGALNTLTRFETVAAIQNMLRFARKGVAFNILKGDDGSDIYNKFWPKELRKLLDFFEGDITLIEGYLEDDFTFFLEHAQPKKGYS